MSDKYHFFWGGPFSQWLASNFVIDGVEYNCAEQYMSAIKGLEPLSPREDYPQVNFHEPLSFSWSEDDDRISQAAKQYLENSNADY